MTTLQVKASSATITDTTQARATRDVLINTGSLFAFDFSNPYCIDLTQAISEGQSINNLLDGAPAALVKSVGGLTAVAGKGFQLGASSAQGRIQIDTGTQYFQNNLGDDFLMIGWANYPATDPGGHIGLLLQKHTGTSYSPGGPWLARRYADIEGKLDNTSTFTSVARPSPSGSKQLAVAKAGGILILYENGIQVGTAALGATPLAANALPLTFGNNTATGFAPAGLVLNAAFAEDLTISAAASGKTTTAQAAAQVAADYAFRSAKF